SEVEIPIMNIRRLVSACRHNEVARDAQVSPTADTRPPEIVQDNVVKLCLMSSFLESGPNPRYRLTVLAGKDKAADVGDLPLLRPQFLQDLPELVTDRGPPRIFFLHVVSRKPDKTRFEVDLIPCQSGRFVQAH